MIQSGLVLVDKPSGWTSHDVVAKLRKILGTKKIGHAGTLDPLATGLLVLGINAGTKLLTFIVGHDKTYRATIRLGSATISDDSESDVIFSADSEKLSAISNEQINTELTKFRGKIKQRPSSVSAIKIQGKRAYDLVRSGEEVLLESREVTVHSFEVLEPPKRGADFIDLDALVVCSSGTYIRALARDLGDALGVGGHLTKLRRIKVGGYDVENSTDVANLESVEIIDLAEAAKALFPLIAITPEQVIDVIHGKKLANFSQQGLVGVLSDQGKLVAVMEGSGMDLKSVVVFQGEING